MRFIFVLPILIFKGSLFLEPLKIPPAVPTCMDDLKVIYKKQLELISLPDNENYHLKYGITAVDQNKRIVKSDVHLYGSKNSSHIITSEMELIQDKKVVISILPKRKTIYINPQSKNLNDIQKFRTKQVGDLRDSVFFYSDVNECKELPTENGISEWVIQLALKEEGVKKYKIKKIDFVLSSDRKEIKSFKIIYPAGHSVSTLQYVFENVDFNFKSDQLSRSALSYVLDGKNLLPVYKGYKIIDNRNAFRNHKQK